MSNLTTGETQSARLLWVTLLFVNASVEISQLVTKYVRKEIAYSCFQWKAKRPSSAKSDAFDQMDHRVDHRELFTTDVHFEPCCARPARSSRLRACDVTFDVVALRRRDLKRG